VVSDDTVHDTALEMAMQMCEYSPYGLQMTKQVIWANLENPSLTAAIELEDRNQLMLGMTDNLPESILAYEEKRKPVYRDEPRRGIYGS
jgi:enoyl-CoA hydratase